MSEIDWPMTIYVVIVVLSALVVFALMFSLLGEKVINERE